MALFSQRPPGGGVDDAEVWAQGSRLLRVGTWNMSHWTAPKVERMQSELGVDVLAVQETHLAPLPLEFAHSTAKRLGFRLHHGRPAVVTPRGLWGRSCGVGFVVRGGVAVQPVVPVGAAWRRLHGWRRLHAVRLPPRPGMPLGMLLLSVYGPVQGHAQQVEKAQFASALLEMTFGLDMQVPTLLMGDFNGAVCPPRDYHGVSGRNRAACPLLSQLLGPGSAWVDVQVALLAELEWTYRQVDTRGVLYASRIDLVLANHAAMAYVKDIRVVTTFRDGGHSPVVVDLQVLGPTAIEWRPPRPKLPVLLHLSSKELLESTDWQALVATWSSTEEVRQALDPAVDHTMDSLSRALHVSLRRVVDLAGGWVKRPPRRRLAYDSNAMRRLRRQLSLLHSIDDFLVRQLRSGPGVWPRALVQLLDRLDGCGLVLPRGTLVELHLSVRGATGDVRRDLQKLERDCRAERVKRWRKVLPRLWRERPGVITGWLRGDSPPWGSTPILNELGEQCLTVDEVDKSVKRFWVDTVLRCHAGVDEASAWAAFAGSQFGDFIPVVQWPQVEWTASRVKLVLSKMREGASPGPLGVPIAVWKALPCEWAAAVGRLLGMVESSGRWPSEWLEAYVTMIPKAAGGSRPEDQRPITVLEVLYRLWAKGVTLEWKDRLQTVFLGDAAMGFRAQTGARHMVQLLSDVVALQAQRREELFFASFDIRKCYDTIPWWAVFGVMRRSGVRASVVDCFEDFARRLNRRFRYGAVDGSSWHAANGLPQGCPASPDELNFLLEAFHRWARSRGFGVAVAGGTIPSCSFADDVVLVGRCQSEIEVLIAAYLEWCGLLGLSVTKVQVWWNGRGVVDVQVGGNAVSTVPVFKVVGVMLGTHEAAVTRMHVEKRIPKALTTVQRLRAVDLPASVVALLWRTVVLPQALWGCEVRNVLPSQLQPLAVAGRAMIATKAPLKLNSWRGPEVLMGPAFGDTALTDPVAEMRKRQLCWLHLLVNLVGIVGYVHREVAWQHGEWREPTVALQAALGDAGWSVRRNVECARAKHWPAVEAEAVYPGAVRVIPQDCFPEELAVFTDGSVMQQGGAAAVQPDTDKILWARVEDAQSSTHCEMVALCLAMAFDTPLILTDSLASLTTVRGWGTWSTARVLRCPVRAEVRLLVDMALQRHAVPRLEKVKAHNDEWLRLQHPMAMGNDRADAVARQAAQDAGAPVWAPAGAAYRDAVELIAAGDQVVLDVVTAFPSVWWRRVRRLRKRTRRWLDALYSEERPINWELSTGIMRRPVVVGDAFVHRATPATIKWVARVRAGCLATRLRLWERKCVGTPACLCCGAAEEDDEHVVAGCPATGTADWLLLLQDAWRSAEESVKVSVPLPATEWVAEHRLQLMAAFIPESLVAMVRLQPPEACRFLLKLHMVVAGAVAERMRRRVELLASLQSSPRDVQDVVSRPTASSCTLPPERMLSVADLRQVEVERRQGGVRRPEASRVPVSGEPRRQWLRNMLVAFLRDEMDLCPPAEGATAEVMVEYFERVTGELFSASPGVSVQSRVSGLGRVVRNLADDGVVEPPLVRHLGSRGVVRWNRRPKGVAADVVAWRRQAEEAEALVAPQPRLCGRVAVVNVELLEWVRNHRFIVPVASEDGLRWESGVALLFLWEVNHAQEFMTRAGGKLAQRLQSFTKRLQARVLRDEEVAGWLRWKDVAAPLMPGLPPSHHVRWSVVVKSPGRGEPREWYDEFIRRWQAYIRSLVGPPGEAPRAAAGTNAMEMERGSVLGKRPATSSGTTPSGRRKLAEAARVQEDDLGTHVRPGATRTASSSSEDITEVTEEFCGLRPPSGSIGGARRRARSTEPEERGGKRVCRQRGRGGPQPRPLPLGVQDVPGGRCCGGAGDGHGRAVLGPPT